jgi:hypothetical protein
VNVLKKELMTAVVGGLLTYVIVCVVVNVFPVLAPLAV